jgi:hypothetical protein
LSEKTNAGFVFHAKALLPESIAAIPDKDARIQENVAAMPDKVARMPVSVATMPDEIARMPVSVAAMPDEVAVMPVSVAAMPDEVAVMPVSIAAMPDEAVCLSNPQGFKNLPTPIKSGERVENIKNSSPKKTLPGTSYSGRLINLNPVRFLKPDRIIGHIKKRTSLNLDVLFLFFKFSLLNILLKVRLVLSQLDNRKNDSCYTSEICSRHKMGLVLQLQTRNNRLHLSRKNIPGIRQFRHFL